MTMPHFSILSIFWELKTPKEPRHKHHCVFWKLPAHYISENPRHHSQEQQEQGIFSAHSLEHEAHLILLLSWLRRKHTRADSAVLLPESCMATHTCLCSAPLRKSTPITLMAMTSTWLNTAEWLWLNSLDSGGDEQ